MIHILEHIGKDSDTFINIMKEIYRICCNNAKIDIVVPHPRNDDFLADPTHVRPITTLGLQLFDKNLNLEWKKAGATNSQLALIHNVNFKIVKTTIILKKKYHQLYESKKINHKQLSDINISNSSWWSRQKVASENYISGVWKSIKNSFVVSDNKKAPLLVTQGDRVDAYRIIKQLAIQMQWSIVSNNSKVFIESKDNLIEFINNNMIDDSFKKHWVSELNNLNLPDQSIKMTELK